MVADQNRGITEAIRRARELRLGGLRAPMRRASDRTPAEQPMLTEMPKFRKVPYDAAICKRNRILLPDAKAGKTGAAAYRMLRARVLQRARSNNWTTIGVTSPGAGEGKSLTAINLALTIAREKNNNVFLIDFDMRNPKLCRYLGLEAPRNIDLFLQHKSDPKECLFSIGIDHLVLAGTNAPTDQSSELLAGTGPEDLFTYIARVAPQPLVIIDLPPLLSTDDALVIAPKVDACLLVVSEGKSRRDGTTKALELLSEFNLAGVVLNRSRTVVSDYYTAS